MEFLAHADQPVAPHDLATAWNLDPLLVGLLVGAVWLHRRGRRGDERARRGRDRAFVGGIAVLVLALVSPLEAASTSLASAHMVQHVLLVLVAAPLFALAAPGSALLRGAPRPVRRAPGGLRRSGLRWTWASHPVVVLVLYVATLWFWHAAGAYQATLEHAWVHTLEHTTFLTTAYLFWRVVLSGRRRRRVPGGLAFLLVFGASMASVLLSLLLTFANDAWYAGYAASTRAWGLTPLEDQQLAGALMWVPAGAIYLAAALSSFASWLRDDALQADAPT